MKDIVIIGGGISGLYTALKLHGNKVKLFKEKSKLDEGWINGGFFVFNKKIFNFIKNDKTFLEREPLQKISKRKLCRIIFDRCGSQKRT